MDEIKAKKTVLAVDDVSINLAILKNILTEHFDVRVAKSGDLALKILERAEIDLILLDIEMPGMSGFEFLDKAREKSLLFKKSGKEEKIPVICVTSHSEDEIVDKAMRAGARDYIVRPVDSGDLKNKLFTALSVI